MELRPVDALVYLYYKCSKCNQVGDEQRLDEVKQKEFHKCLVCGNVDRLRPVDKVRVLYGKAQTTQPKPMPSSLVVDKATNILIGQGYKKKHVTNILRDMSGNTVQDLVKSAILELDDASE